MHKLVILLFLLISSISTAQVADFTQLEQYVEITPFDSSYVNFHPFVTHSQKIGIVGQDIYIMDQKCLVESYELEDNEVTPYFNLKCQGNEKIENLNFDNWYLIGGLEKINSKYKGIEFKFDNSNEEFIFGMDNRKVSMQDRFIIKEIRYGKIDETTFSLVLFFENGYIESMKFLDFKPYFISKIKTVLPSDASKIESNNKNIIIVNNRKMIAIE